jgi:hypothetical protein
MKMSKIIKKNKMTDEFKYFGILYVKKWYLFIAMPIIFLTMMIIIPWIDALFIIIYYGMDAFKNGLRFQNSKRGLLTNGEELSYFMGLIRYFIFILVFFIDSFIVLFCIKMIDKFVIRVKTKTTTTNR